MTEEMRLQWIKELDEAVLSLDLKKFKAFIKKWHDGCDPHPWRR